MELTRQQRGLIVTLNFNHGGSPHTQDMTLQDVQYEYTESFASRLLEADGETVAYHSKNPLQPLSGSITGHVEDDYADEPENELDAIWQFAGESPFDHDDDDWMY